VFVYIDNIVCTVYMASYRLQLYHNLQVSNRMCTLFVYWVLHLVY
jgi:hypothetical protein